MAIEKDAAPRLQRAFDMSAEQEYKTSVMPKLKIRMGDGEPGGWLLGKGIEVPWKGDIRAIVAQVTREARDAKANLTLNLKRPCYTLETSCDGSGISGQLGISFDLKGNWGRPTKGLVRMNEVLFGTADDDEVWDVWLKTVANIVPDDQPTHPSVKDTDTTITVYRGISLDRGDDPTSGRINDQSPRENMGGSWTSELAIAKAIAERGQAGFNLDNIGGKEYRIRPGDNIGGRSYDKPVTERIPTVLRAEVVLGDNASLYAGMGGYRYLTSEREVDIPQGTEFTLTGWMQATEIPVDPRQRDRAFELWNLDQKYRKSGKDDEEAKAFYEKLFNEWDTERFYDVTYRWPSGWKDVHLKRRAKKQDLGVS